MELLWVVMIILRALTTPMIKHASNMTLPEKATLKKYDQYPQGRKRPSEKKHRNNATLKQIFYIIGFNSDTYSLKEENDILNIKITGIADPDNTSDEDSD
eukprot:2079654-Ditylum_brightwellii.AAC.1